MRGSRNAMKTKVEIEPLQNGALFKDYEIQDQLGRGGFGITYYVKNIKDMKYYALKCDLRQGENNGLDREIRILRQLRNVDRIPKTYEAGEFNNCRFMIMDVYGASISAIRKFCSTLDSRSLLFVAFHTLICIKKVHDCGIVHRDVKPGNFLFNPTVDNPIIIIDFGLSKRYRDPHTDEVVPPMDKCGFIGTTKYASLNCHFGKDLCCKDDLCSWLYMCVELYRGKLPWTGKTKKDEVAELKKRFSMVTLVRRLPKCFEEIAQHIESLDYYKKPDYDKLLCGLLDEYLKLKGPLKWEHISKKDVDSISKVPLCYSQKEKTGANTGDAAGSTGAHTGTGKGGGGCCAI